MTISALNEERRDVEETEGFVAVFVWTAGIATGAFGSFTTPFADKTVPTAAICIIGEKSVLLEAGDCS